MCDEGKNVSERLKKQDKEGENTEKIVYNAQKRCKIIVEKYVYIPIYNRYHRNCNPKVNDNENIYVNVYLTVFAGQQRN